MIGTTDIGTDADEHSYTNYGEPEEVEDEVYSSYSPSTNRRSVETYQAMVDEPWVDDSLQELLETRIDDMLER